MSISQICGPRLRTPCLFVHASVTQFIHIFLPSDFIFLQRTVTAVNSNDVRRLNNKACQFILLNKPYHAHISTCVLWTLQIQTRVKFPFIKHLDRLPYWTNTLIGHPCHCRTILYYPQQPIHPKNPIFFILLVLYVRIDRIDIKIKCSHNLTGQLCEQVCKTRNVKTHLIYKGLPILSRRM